MRAVVLLLVLLAACGDSFAPAAELDGGAADADAAGLPSEGGAEGSPPVNGDSGADVDAAMVIDAAAGDAGHDASSDKDAEVCTPIGAYTAPTTCACFFAGSCPADGGTTTCLWAETPLTITGQPTCRGCGQITFKPNTCGRCKETFNCACLAAYLDPGQRCCEGVGGPYLSDYACP